MKTINWIKNKIRKYGAMMRDRMYAFLAGKWDFNERHSIHGVLESIKAVGFSPKTIIDIGIYMGTEGLYNVWPEARICLIEPLEENMIYLKQIEKKYPSVLSLNVAASNKDGEIEIWVSPIGAGIITNKAKERKRKVPTMAIDNIVKDYQLKPPYILKIDTDGHEREILSGARNCLNQAELCIIEIHKFAHLMGNDTITPYEIFSFMDECGMAFYDFAGRSYGLKPDVRALRIIDMVFARRDGVVFQETYKVGEWKGDKTKRRLKQREAAKRRNPNI